MRPQSDRQIKEAGYGDLDRVTAVIKLGGFVNSTADATEQAKVINGASALMFEILENKGKHARSAVTSRPFSSALLWKYMGYLNLINA